MRRWAPGWGPAVAMVVSLATACSFDTSADNIGPAGAAADAGDQPLGPDGCAALSCQPEQCGIVPDACGGDIDCGQCPCEGFPLEDTCTEDDICIDAECSAAFGRSYELSVSELTVNALRPDGDDWDLLTDAPDPFVVVMLDGAEVLTTEIVRDVFTPVFGESTMVVIPAGVSLRLFARDDDLGSDDEIIDCTIEPLTADTLGLRLASCLGTAAAGTLGTTLTIQLVPQ